MNAGEWTEEWYRKPWGSASPAASLCSADADLQEIQQIRRRFVGDDVDDEASWEETPECGYIKNVKQKIGERLSRVTPHAKKLAAKLAAWVANIEKQARKSDPEMPEYRAPLTVH